MESRFGQDFRQVRIYTDARAAESARAVDALAYTVGQRIVFGAGQYAPQTGIGQQVLAHELTHTVQQDNNQLRRQPPPRIKISKPIVSTDAEQARRKGRELAELIKTGKWGPKNDEQLGHWLEFFEGSAWNAFLSELEDALGEKSPEGEGESKEHPEGAVTESSLLIPIAKPEVVRGGFKIAFFAQILEESSDSTSVEVYNDLSASAGVSVEIPIKKIAKFRFSAEAKTGRKETEKTEEKKTRRTGQTISRTFTVQKLEREGLKYEYLKIYHGVTPSRETLMLPKAQIAHRVTREGRGYNPREIQVGYQIVPEEGGKLWGPFWEVYEGSLPVKGSALTQVWKVISAEQRKIAEDLVFGGNN
jgi:hypothetical protein